MVCGRDMGSTKRKFVPLYLYTSRGYTGPPNCPDCREWGRGASLGQRTYVANGHRKMLRETSLRL